MKALGVYLYFDYWHNSAYQCMYFETLKACYEYAQYLRAKGERCKILSKSW